MSYFNPFERNIFGEGGTGCIPEKKKGKFVLSNISVTDGSLIPPNIHFSGKLHNIIFRQLIALFSLFSPNFSHHR